MKLALLLAIAGLSLFAADPAKTPPTPEIDPAIQIEVLAAQLNIVVAENKAGPYESAVDRAKEAAQPSLQKAAAACNKNGVGKYVPNFKDGKVVCELKPPETPQRPPANPPTTPVPAAK